MHHSAFGAGYGHGTDEGATTEARAREIGLELDATYTAKALARCLRAMEAGETGSEVMFLDSLSSAPLAEHLAEAPVGLPGEIEALLV